MRDNVQNSSSQERFADIFAHLRSQDVEQFYAHYQLWVMHHRIPILENELAALRSDIAENQRRIQNLRPSAIALSVLARLQANGVSDVELLDQMLERGEDWLDRMMQRLDYCEQVEDFIQGDYTQWCVHSLEGAYDWIDTMRGSLQKDAPALQATDESSEAEVQATAELLLHKLSFDDEETMRDVNQKYSDPASEESAETAEHPTHEQTLHLLATAETAPANQPSAEAEAGAPERTATPVSEPPAQDFSTEEANEQPAPWYSINQEDANEPFDFTHPQSMDDWIKILQAETSASQAAPAEPQVATGIPGTPTISREETVQEGTLAEGAVPIQPESQEATQREGEPVTEQPEACEAEVGECAAGLAVEEGETSSNVSEAVAPLASEAEMTGEIAEQATSAEPAQPAEEETIPGDGRATLEQPAAEQEMASRTNAVSEQPVVEQEETDLAEQEPTSASEQMEEDLKRAGESEQEQPQHEIEEAGIVNAIVEPEGAQRPWYEYLVIDKTISSELHNAHEIAEHSLFGEEQLNHQGEPLDETQPIARKAIQANLEEQHLPETAPQTTGNEPGIDISDSKGVESSKQAAASSEKETPEEDFPTLKSAAPGLESEVSALPPQEIVADTHESAITGNTGTVEAIKIAAGEEPSTSTEVVHEDEGETSLATPQKGAESEAAPDPPAITASASSPESQRSAGSEPVQQPPEKLSFWQRLFRRKRKK